MTDNLTAAQKAVLAAIRDNTTPPYKGGPLEQIKRILREKGYLDGTNKIPKPKRQRPEVPADATSVTLSYGAPSDTNPIIGYTQKDGLLWVRYVFNPTTGQADNQGVALSEESAIKRIRQSAKQYAA